MIRRYRLLVGDNKNEVYLLGYKLSVTPCEYKLLCALLSDERVRIEMLAEILGFTPGKKGNVSVHICSLNRKADVIGGRKLILCDNSEYYLNPHM